MMPDPPNPYADTQLVSGHTVTVYSNPQLGAIVEFDGQVRGRTPTIMRGIPSGEHTVKLRLDGFEELVQTVDVQANTYLDLTMQPQRGATQLLGGTQLLRVPQGSRLPYVLAIAGVVVLVLLIAGVAALALTRGPSQGGTTVAGASTSVATSAPRPATPTPRPTSTIAAAVTGGVPTPEPSATARPTILPTVTLSRAQDRTGTPVDPTTAFGPDDPIFVSAQTGNLPVGTVVRILIVADRVPGAPPNFEFARADVPVGASGRVGVGLLGPIDGWPIGRYRANLFVGDTLDQSLEFQVR
jgi:hypothetical protein